MTTVVDPVTWLTSLLPLSSCWNHNVKHGKEKQKGVIWLVRGQIVLVSSHVRVQGWIWIATTNYNCSISYQWRNLTLEIGKLSISQVLTCLPCSRWDVPEWRENVGFKTSKWTRLIWTDVRARPPLGHSPVSGQQGDLRLPSHCMEVRR